MEILEKESITFNINSYFYNLMDGNTSYEYKIEITYPVEDKDVVVGNIELRYFPRIYDFNDQLDEHGSSEIFLPLFKKNNGRFKKSVTDQLGDVFTYSYSLMILEKIEIKDEFKGHKLMKSTLYRVLDYLNLTSLNVALVLKAFPLQYESKDENFDFTNFKKDKTKLSKYYESIGFKELDKENSIYGMNTKLGYSLLL